MTFARRVFLIAGLYGIAVLAPQLFLEEQFSRNNPPALTHPEFYYGFVGTALAWQIAFLLVARDPARYRPLMPAMLAEKGIFAAAVPALYLQHRVPALLLVFASIDGVFGILFWAAYRRTSASRKRKPEPRPLARPEATRKDRPSDTEILIHDLSRALDRGPGTSN